MSKKSAAHAATELLLTRLRTLQSAAQQLAGSNARLELIRRDYSDLLPMLALIYDPKRPFRVRSESLLGGRNSQQPGKIKRNFMGKNEEIFEDLSAEDLDLKALLDGLNRRRWTGARAHRVISAFLARHDAHRDLILCVLDKNLNMRVSHERLTRLARDVHYGAMSAEQPWLVNGLPRVALAESLERARKRKFIWETIDKHSDPTDANSTDWYVSRKWDGIRCWLMLDPTRQRPKAVGAESEDKNEDDGAVRWRSRQGKPLLRPGHRLTELARRHLLPFVTRETIIDGELCVIDESIKFAGDKGENGQGAGADRDDYQRTMSAVMTTTSPAASKPPKKTRNMLGLSAQQRQQQEEARRLRETGDDMRLHLIAFDYLPKEQLDSGTLAWWQERQRSLHQLFSRAQLIPPAPSDAGAAAALSFGQPALSSGYVPPPPVQSSPTAIPSDAANTTTTKLPPFLLTQQLKITGGFAEITEHADRAAERGWEGLILRRNAPYVGKRSFDILKVKQFEDAEYTVLDVQLNRMRLFVDGVEREVNAVGSVVVDHKGTRVNVGSGLTAEQRIRFAQDPKQIIGKMVTVKYFSETAANSLRFPSIKCVWESGKRTV